jgi:hypothetical protein
MQRKKCVVWILGITVSFLVIASLYLGYQNFSSLDVQSKIENLRWLSSALIQSLAAILAIVPAVGLALLSFLVSRYPSRLKENLWDYSEWFFFLALMIMGIVLCYFVLISIPEASSTKTCRLRLFLVMDTAAILTTFVAIFVVLRKISASTNIENIFEIVKDNIIRESKLDMSLKEIKIQRKLQRRDIGMEMWLAENLSLSKVEEFFEDYFSLMVSLAENKDLTGLKVGLVKLFDLMLSHDRFYRKVIITLGDFLSLYRNRQILPYPVLRDMIHKQYHRVSRSENSLLIKNILNPALIEDILISKYIHNDMKSEDVIPIKSIVEDFYGYRVLAKGYVPEMNPSETIELVEMIVEFWILKETERMEKEDFWTFFADHIIKFIIDAWGNIERQETDTVKVIHIIKRLLEKTEREEAQKVELAIKNLEGNLMKFEKGIESKYRDTYKGEILDWLEKENKKYKKGKIQFENVPSALHREITEVNENDGKDSNG